MMVASVSLARAVSPRPRVRATTRACATRPRVLLVRAAGEEVFVAGATGRTGIRVVRELQALGFSVRAGVRDVRKADKIFRGEDAPAGIGYTGEKDAPLPIDLATITLVQCDVEDTTSLQAAMSGAQMVVSAIGAPESQPLDSSLPSRIDGQGAKNLVDAATACGVEHFVMVSSLGTGAFGWPASVLNLFWNVLEHKRTAELALIQSGLNFTIVRPGGMERPTDDYSLTHQTRIYAEDTQFGGQVSRLQVAQLCAQALRTPAASANKIMEVVAEEGAPAVPLAALMEPIATVTSGGPPPPPGSPEAYQRKYLHTRTDTEKWADVMGFAGWAPEAVNSRLAMLGALGCLGAQAMGRGSVATQLAATPTFTLGLTAVVVVASMVPFVKGVTTTAAKAGPFNPTAEAANGRLAMLALACVIAVEATTGGVFLDVLSEGLSSIF